MNNYLSFLILIRVAVQDLSDLWTVVIVLLEDDDQLVRNTISLLSNTEVKLPLR